MTEGHTGTRYLVAVDGACVENPGPGGWGAIIHKLHGETIVSRHALSGCADGDTTNQKMELEAAIGALSFLRDTTDPITIISDSQYLVKGMTEWLSRWKAQGWRRGDRKPVLNREIWETLDRLSEGREITWVWTSGHDGHPMHEAADQLAQDAAHRKQDALRQFYPELFSEN